MFLVSFFIVILTTYFCVSMINSKLQKNSLLPVLFFLLSFAQIVFSFEILSLFNSISESKFLLLNIFFLILSLCMWLKFERPKCNFDFIKEFKKIVIAIKKDKLLTILSCSFVCFLVVSFLNSIFLPITFGDALTYYLTRVTTWIQNGNINHWVTPDVRELIMPVNMDFLYTWFILFQKKEIGTAIFSFIGFINLVYILYSFLGEFHIAIRKRVWAIVVLSSFSLLSHMISVPCSELFLSALLLASLYLFFVFVKTGKKYALYFSTLAIALAIGTKTTAIVLCPSLIILMGLMMFFYGKNEFKKIKKDICFFALFLFVNVLVFSAYNYILNFLEFGNFISSKEEMLIHEFLGGVKCYFSNLLNYIFIIFDASGIKGFDFYNNFITNFRESIFEVLKLNLVECRSVLFESYFKYDSTISMTKGALGILGLLLFLPSIFISIINLFCYRRKSKNVIFISIFALIFIFNILLFSKFMVFSSFNVRYLITFVCLSSPILIFSYIPSNKNLFKIFVSILIFYYLLIIPSGKLLSVLHKYMYVKKNYPKIQNPYEIVSYRFNDENQIYQYLKKRHNAKIALVAYSQKSRLYDIEKLKLEGFYIDKLLVENITSYDIKQYDFIVVNIAKIDSTYVYGQTNWGNDYVPVCEYKNNRLKTIDYDKEKVAIACCDIPFEFFEKNGFELIDKEMKELKLKKYRVLANRK